MRAEGTRKRTHDGFGGDEARTVGVVEVCYAFASEFQVLALVFADGDVCCSDELSQYFGHIWSGI
jgi:hypothetical protein